MKWNELRKIAEERGWRFVRHGANHDVYNHPERTKDDVLYIGRHGKQEIASGSFFKIKKQIGF